MVVLHLAVGADEARQAGHRHDVGIAARVDRDGRAQRQRGFLVVGPDAEHAVPVEDHARDRRVEQNLDACIGQQRVRGLAPDQRVVDAREGLAVADRSGEPAAPFHLEDELVDEAVDDLLRRRAGIVGCLVEAADRAGEPGDRAAAAEAVAFQEADAQARPRGRHRRGDPCGSAADDQHVEAALDRPARIASHVPILLPGKLL